MAKVPPARTFKRVAEAFDEAARAQARRLCEEDSPPETTVDLSDLVKSFIEDGDIGEEREGNGSESDRRYCSDTELREELRGLLMVGSRGGNDDDDEVRENIRVETEQAGWVIGKGPSSPGFKRRLVTRLRERGFDAGLCKSKWDRLGRFPSGSYEYIDVNKSGTRYIIEFSLSAEFEIARPTETYTSLLQLLPPIFVGKVEELKQVVRLMCNAIKVSMRRVEMHVPPWRRFGYMKAKWFNPEYKRTIGKANGKTGSGSDSGSDLGKKRPAVGFVVLPPPAAAAISYHCREDFASKGGMKVGKLAMAFL